MTSFLVILIYLLAMSLPISDCDARHLEAHAKFISCGHSTKGMASTARPDRNASPSSLARKEMATAPPSTEEIRARNGAPDDGRRVNETECHREEEEEEEAASASSSGASSACWPSEVKSKSSLKIDRGALGARAEQPGFDVDYIGPRTHPPSHN